MFNSLVVVMIELRSVGVVIIVLRSVGVQQSGCGHDSTEVGGCSSLGVVMIVLSSVGVHTVWVW